MLRLSHLSAALLCALPALHAAPLPTILPSGGAGSPYYSQQGLIQSQRRALLSVPVAGRITTLSVAAGAQVRAGQLLLQVDGEAAQQGAAASAAQISSAQTQLQQAEREYQRMQKLAAQQFISAAALESAQAALASAKAQARAQVATARAAGAQAGLYRLSAPFAGTVARVDGELGALALPGQSLVELYDPAALRVEVQLPSSLYHRVQQQPPQLSWRGQALNVGRVEWFPAADAASQTRTVRINLAAGSRLPVGEMASVRFALHGEDRRLTVPLAAVSRQREFDAVYVVAADGKPAMRYVRLGALQDGRLPVLAGLRAGERIAANAEQAAALSGVSR